MMVSYVLYIAISQLTHLINQYHLPHFLGGDDQCSRAVQGLFSGNESAIVGLYYGDCPMWFLNYTTVCSDYFGDDEVKNYSLSTQLPTVAMCVNFKIQIQYYISEKFDVVKLLMRSFDKCCGYRSGNWTRFSQLQVWYSIKLRLFLTKREKKEVTQELEPGSFVWQSIDSTARPPVLLPQQSWF